jgi:hypothetical protein
VLRKLDPTSNEPVKVTPSTSGLLKSPLSNELPAALQLCQYSEYLWSHELVPMTNKEKRTIAQSPGLKTGFPPADGTNIFLEQSLSGAIFE